MICCEKEKKSRIFICDALLTGISEKVSKMHKQHVEDI